MYIHHAGDRTPKEMAPGIEVRTFWGENMLVSITELDAHTSGALHSHPHEQAGAVMDGAVDFVVDGAHYTAAVGDVFVIPGNVEHSASTGDHRAVLLEVFSPVREEFKY